MDRYSFVKVRFQKYLRLVYKPHSVHGARAPLCSHLSGQHVTMLLVAAYPGLCGDEQSPIVRRRFHPCLALLPAGVAWPSALLQTPVVSYTTFSPSPHHKRGCLFLWPIRQVTQPRMLSDAVLYGVRTFLDPAMQDRDCPTNLS
jgi:hypothetical protein